MQLVAVLVDAQDADPHAEKYCWLLRRDLYLSLVEKGFAKG
jgi:hypothetical protein